ncbi:MAG: lipocalin family protein [Saprospiraceae bacterium]|nr:lipocalin family protein [Saprospiraceae bacterium]
MINLKISALFFVLFSTYACSKDDNNPTESPIIGKWFITKMVDLEITPQNQDTLETEFGTGSYWDFKADGSLSAHIAFPNSIIKDTVGSYSYTANKLTLFDTDTTIYDVLELSKNKLILHQLDTMDNAPGESWEGWLYFEK